MWAGDFGGPRRSGGTRWQVPLLSRVGFPESSLLVHVTDLHVLERMFLLLVCGRLITVCLMSFSTMREFGLSGYNDAAAAWEFVG